MPATSQVKSQEFVGFFFFPQYNEVNIYAFVMPGFHPEIFQEEFINI